MARKPKTEEPDIEALLGDDAPGEPETAEDLDTETQGVSAVDGLMDETAAVLDQLLEEGAEGDSRQHFRDTVRLVNELCDRIRALHPEYPLKWQVIAIQRISSAALHLPTIASARYPEIDWGAEFAELFDSRGPGWN
jgi:hypothetical protein